LIVKPARPSHRASSPSSKGRSCRCRVRAAAAPEKTRRRRCCRPGAAVITAQGEGGGHRGVHGIATPGAGMSTPLTRDASASWLATHGRTGSAPAEKALSAFPAARWRFGQRCPASKPLPRKHFGQQAPTQRPQPLFRPCHSPTRHREFSMISPCRRPTTAQLNAATQLPAARHRAPIQRLRPAGQDHRRRRRAPNPGRDPERIGSGQSAREKRISRTNLRPPTWANGPLPPLAPPPQGRTIQAHRKAFASRIFGIGEAKSWSMVALHGRGAGKPHSHPAGGRRRNHRRFVS